MGREDARGLCLDLGSAWWCNVTVPGRTSVAEAPRLPAPERPMNTSVAPARWLRVREAAELLSMSEEALRRALERRATRAPDGGIEADYDGVRGRKLGRTWRVCLSERWQLAVLKLRDVG